MKSKLYILVLLFSFLVFASAQAQIPNSGFESWTLDGDNNLNPDSWETTNSNPVVTVEQYTPAYAGNYSLRAFAVDLSVVTLAGVAYTSFPLNARPTHLRACFKATIMPGDFAYIMFAAWSGDSVIAAQDSCTFKIDSTISQFTCVNLPITYVSQLVADSATILISGGDLSNAQLGTEIIVDELSFLGVGIDETENSAIAFQPFPNPASAVMSISLALKKNTTLALHVYDVNGREVLTEKSVNVPAGDQAIRVHVAGLAEGIYCCRLENATFSAAGKFIIAR
jgi:hypothetical protein